MSDVLVFPRDLREDLVRLARDGEPDEVCGILAGRGHRVERVFAVRNAADSIAADRGVFRDRGTGEVTVGHKPVHYYMDPKDQLRVYNAIDDLDMDVVGYYHSHTHTEARPSPTDIRLAVVPHAFWILVGQETPGRWDVRAWRILKDDPSAESGTLEEVTVVDA